MIKLFDGFAFGGAAFCLFMNAFGAFHEGRWWFALWGFTLAAAGERLTRD